jgi:hypothetical protein
MSLLILVDEISLDSPPSGAGLPPQAHTVPGLPPTPPAERENYRRHASGYGGMKYGPLDWRSPPKKHAGPVWEDTLIFIAMHRVDNSGKLTEISLVKDFRNL